MEDFDVIVVGAGPGGSVTAKTASEQGYRTCLLEKEKISIDGRYKACGGAIAKELFEEIDYPEEKLSRTFESLELHHVDGDRFSKKGEGAVIWRNIFDKYLTDMAIECGTILKEEEPLIEIKKDNELYEVSTNKGIYRANYVIAADGATSQTLKALSWPYFSRENLILTITQEMRSNKQNIESKLGNNTIHAFFGIKNLITVGYAWLFPKAKTITVGWGNQINLIKNSREEFKKFISLPYVKEALLNSKLSIFKPHLIPVGLRPLIYKENVFAVGDAGGIVDPISGKGIPYAMMSGQIAIDTIKYCEEKDKPDKLGPQYEKRLDRKFLRILKAKRIARDKIFQNDDSLIRFLTLWEKYRSSEIVMRKLI